MPEPCAASAFSGRGGLPWRFGVGLLEPIREPIAARWDFGRTGPQRRFGVGLLEPIRERIAAGRDFGRRRPPRRFGDWFLAGRGSHVAPCARRPSSKCDGDLRMLSCALTVHDAWKRFASTQALAGVGLELRRGECLALLGPNGAGKTTLVRAIGGRVRLDRGQIAIQAASSSSNGCSSLGVVPQEIAIYPLLTARENLEVFARLRACAAANSPTALRGLWSGRSWPSARASR